MQNSKPNGRKGAKAKTWCDYSAIDPSCEDDNYELTTTNIMPVNYSSLNSSDTEIAIDAWEELGEADLARISNVSKSPTNELCPSPSRIRETKNTTVGDDALLAVREFKNLVKNETSLKSDDHNNDNLLNTESFETITSMDDNGSSTTSIGNISIGDPLELNELRLQSSSFQGTEEYMINQILARGNSFTKSNNQNNNVASRRSSKITKILAVPGNNSKITKGKKTKNNKAKVSRGRKLPPPPPGKHRITIYDSSVERHGVSIIPKVTPLHCNFIDIENGHQSQNSNSGVQGCYQVLISDKEFRLLQSFSPVQKRKSVPPATIFVEPKKEVSQQRTLFGWVSSSSAAATTKSSQSSSASRNNKQLRKPTQSKIPVEYQRNTTKLGYLSPKPSYEDVGEGTTDSDFLLNVAKSTSSSAETQTHTLSDIEWKMMRNYDSRVTSNTMLNNKSTSPSLEESAGKMRRSITTASEASIILMNTIFKEIFNDPNVSNKILEEELTFQDFINCSNEIDALEKAAILFASCTENIQKYLKNLRKECSSSSSAPASCSNFSSKALNYGKSADSRRKVSGSESNFRTGDRKLDSNIWNCVMPTAGTCPKYFQISVISKPGIILETIYCNNYEFSMVYSGGPERINILESATREKAESIRLNPQRLLEMIDRNASFASGRIISSKYYLSFVSNELGILVQKFISGKYSKILTTKKWNSKVASKLQGINTFAGVILQTSTAFFSVCKKIKNAVEKAMRLDDLLRIPRLPGLTCNNNTIQTAAAANIANKHNNVKNSNDLNNNNTLQSGFVTQEFGIPAGSKLPIRDAVMELSYCPNEIDMILVTIKNSLDSLNAGVKVKSTYRKKIEFFFLAVKQLEFGHDIDFATVLMSLVSNAAVIQALSNSLLPTVDVEMRSRILASLGHLNWGCGELLKLVKKICLLSSFVTSKSIGRLRKMIAFERARKLKKKNQKCFGRRKSKNAAAVSAGGNIASHNLTMKKNLKAEMKVNIQLIGEQRKEKEETKIKELKEELATLNSLD